MIVLKFEIEDALAEVVNAPGSMQAITTAVHKRILELKTSYWEKQARAPAANAYQGTAKH